MILKPNIFLQSNAIYRLFLYLWPKDSFSLRFRFVLASLALLLSKLAALIAPLFFKETVDTLNLTPANGWPVVLLFLILSYGAVRLIASFLNEIRIAIFAPVENQAAHRISVEVFAHLQKLSLRFHLERRSGGLLRSAERGVKAIENFLWFTVHAFLPAFLELFFVIATMWILYDWYYAFITLVGSIAYITFTILFTEWRTKIQRQLNNLNTLANARSMDTLLNYETVKYFSNEAIEIENFDKLMTEYEKTSNSSKKALALLNFGQGGIIALSLTLITLLSAWNVSQHLLTVGDFVLVNTYLLQVFIPLGFLGFAYRETKQAVIDMEEMFLLLDRVPEIVDSPKAKRYVFKGGKIEFKNVSFSYNPDRKILRDISFGLEPGKTLAVVGESGAGKSTLSRLIFRFYDITSGQILIDDQDIKNIKQQSLRHAIGIVPQDVVLFNESIYYNIAYGNPKAKTKDVEEAAKSAQIHKFITKLPEGYNTLVGERGLKLSGGEKQRIAIARMLLKKPPIFIFDEATSALDTHTEKEIQKCLQKISSHHTTLIIAHRLSTIAHADEILVMAEGRIAERGRHQSLLAKGGLYAQLWNRQQYEEKLQELIEKR